jgi:D-aminopeptidase
MIRPGPRNLITDVSGLLVGNSSDPSIATGTTVLTAERPFTAAVHVMGGAPGTRETDVLEPGRSVPPVDALVLSGGSALGLAAASGVSDALRAAGRGFDVGGQKVPIVPAAIIFDLLNGGDKNWDTNPYPALGEKALGNAGQDFELGTAGAGFGGTTAGLMGGLGSASAVLPNGITIGALVAVNPLGSVIVGDGPHFWSAAWEMDAEFGGLGAATKHDPTRDARTKISAMRENTTIAIVATDANLSHSQTNRVAVAAHDGMARAIVPSHTPNDGDLVFAVSTGAIALDDPMYDLLDIGHVAATCLSRAIARAVFNARPGVFPSWSQKYAGSGTK